MRLVQTLDCGLWTVDWSWTVDWVMDSYRTGTRQTPVRTSHVHAYA